MNNNYLLIQHRVGSILKLENSLIIKINDIFHCLGKIKNILGSIENPYYLIKLDDYLYSLNIPLNTLVYIC